MQTEIRKGEVSGECCRVLLSFYVLNNREFLEGREKEVISIRMALFDEEKIMRTHIASERREASREAAEKMLKNGKIAADEISEYFTDLSERDIQEIEKE